ncbi:Sua5/YciO/YrdC/YwlC family protein [Thecamonas trahens ATCC 50062]|uniref:Threonylcarbamoyl-AMP synthase n=1 Tax=Thecamonas trahens ATCC 50062 TaxID=461836 RepID=A0A0L0DLH4_THETB|nr:Sua5/YciO/YrdC/YwlC family protein [Thecamonas trahens ATCC 50062]KNC53085.1 Sua5/YciO/YrdC/YwlC family protein [Thecamonas trahens ATCC 50062]|eukprot:XP_013754758.1 Sua5/YciO/YrdC/YwlC family protein [Thecamonas trahens ATCC 50062]
MAVAVGDWPATILHPSSGFHDDDQVGGHVYSRAETDTFECTSLYPLASLEASLAEPAAVLAGGGVVGFPTETVYGLGANALSADAVAGIFAAKRRPADNPLIVHVSGREMLAPLVDLDGVGASQRAVIDGLMTAFWPGPLTLLLPKSAAVPDEVTAGHPTVGVRMPSHSVARALIAAAGVPLAAPSANLSGRPSPTTAGHVLTDLGGRIPWVVDGGSCDFGLESTVVDPLREPPMVLRPGAVTLEQLRSVAPDMVVHSGEVEEAPATPGLKYTHYSPSAPVVVFDGGSPEAMSRSLASWCAETSAAAEAGAPTPRIGLVATRPDVVVPPTTARVIQLFDTDDRAGAAAAHGLFAALRELDEDGCTHIIIEGVSRAHFGLAVMNRALKAASRTVVCHEAGASS